MANSKDDESGKILDKFRNRFEINHFEINRFEINPEISAAEIEFPGHLRMTKVAK